MRLQALILFLGLALMGIALACQVPVFRFALERWEADPYVVRIFPGSSGEYSEDEQAAIDFLEEHRFGADTESGVFANLHLALEEGASGEEGDAEKEKGEKKAPEEKEAAKEAPKETPHARMTVSYPQRYRHQGFDIKPIWEGALKLETARRLVDSPARREIVKRLLGGQSAVWILLESGNAEVDKAAEEAIGEAIAVAKEELTIPEGVMTIEEAESAANPAYISPDDVLRSVVPLKIDFSLLRVSRNDPAEAMFLPMLLNIEDDLGEFEGEPMVFPVFGRGRLLEPLIGKGVNADNALEYSAYICGSCSCEVKDQNPGQDLLIAADWWSALEGSEVVIDKILPPLEGTGILSQAVASSTESGAPDAKETESGEEDSSTEPSGGHVEIETEEVTTGPATKGVFKPTTFAISPLILIGGTLVLVLGVGTFFILRKKPS